MKERVILEGQRYTRRRVTVTATPDGDSYVETIDPLTGFAPARHLKNALGVLDEAGIPAREILAEHGGAAVMRFVIYGRLGDSIGGGGSERAPDSREGIAARIVFTCYELLERQKLGETGPRMLHLAYTLGQLVSIDRVYDTDAAMRRAGSAQRAKAAKAQSANRKREWLKLRREIRRERIFESPTTGQINAAADKRLAQRLRLSASTIANQRNRERWLA